METAHEALEAKLGHQFRNHHLLQRALTHRSWLEGRVPAEASQDDNEQLEFLGDSILGFVVSEVLVLRHPDAREGQLSTWKAHLVSAAHLHACALELGLGEYMLLGRGEDRNGGRERRTLLSDATEALIAAIYIDGGMEPARRFIEAHILQAIPNLDALVDSKMDLRMRAAGLGLMPPRYVTIGREGPEHAKIFVVEARLSDDLVARARGTSKKAASLLAARELLVQLDVAAARRD